MINHALQKYLSTITRQLDTSGRTFRDRRFELAKNEGRVAAEDLAYRGWFATADRHLKRCWNTNVFVLIGDPGSGKSVVLQQAVRKAGDGEKASAVAAQLRAMWHAAEHIPDDVRQ
jgi:hypothetical protein